MKVRALAALLVLPLAACVAGSDDAAAEGADEAEVRTLDLIGPEPSGQPTRYPFVLVHGFNASPARWGFYAVKEALEADGHEVYVAELPPFQSSEVRATYLQRTVDRALEGGKGKVNILAHSMGGLDSRVLVSPRGLAYGDRVATITTISTPHHGSAMADAVLAALDRHGVDDEAIDRFFTWLGASFSEVANDVGARAAFLTLSEANAAEFAAKYPDDERVFYRSVAGVSNVAAIPNPKDWTACEGTYYLRASGRAAYPGPGGRPDAMNVLLKPIARTVAHGLRELRPNDGLVTVESAKYGLFLGCIPADHMGEIGQDVFKRPDRTTGFSHVRFYRNLAFDLARSGY